MTVSAQLVRWKYRQAVSPKTALTVSTTADVGVDWSHRAEDNPSQIQFTSEHVGAVTVWLWDFGDSSTSSSVNPNHQYVFQGIDEDFVVRLTVNSGPFEQKTITVVNPIAAPGATALVAQDLTINQSINMTVAQAGEMKAIA